MAFESNRAITMTPVAAAVNRNRFVAVVTAGEVDEAGANGDAVGVSADDSAASNQVAIPVTLLDGGKIEVEAGATVAAGVRVMSDATGRAITATGATARVLGFSLNGADVGEALTIVGQKAAGEFVA